VHVVASAPQLARCHRAHYGEDVICRRKCSTWRKGGDVWRCQTLTGKRRWSSFMSETNAHQLEKVFHLARGWCREIWGMSSLDDISRISRAISGAAVVSRETHLRANLLNQ
jgi:hypothetical protein